MECKEIEKFFIEIIEGKNISDYKEIKNHIEKCRKCKNNFEEIEKILKLAKKIEVPQFSESFWQSQKEKLFVEKRPYRIHFKLILSYIASLVVIISISFFFFSKKLNKSKENSSLLVFEENILPSEEQILKLIDYMNEEDITCILNVLMKE